MEKLTSRERNILRKEAHTLKPVVMIGKNGVTPELKAAVDAALADHELIKIKFLDFKSSPSLNLKPMCVPGMARVIFWLEI